MKKRCLFICIFNFFVFSSAFSQFYSGGEHWTVGLDVGMNKFLGDVSNVRGKSSLSTPFTKDFYQHRNVMLQATFGKDLAPFWNLRLNVLYGHVKGAYDDKNLAFFARNTHQIGILNSINIFGFFNSYTLENWQLNINIGAAVYGYQTKLFDKTTGVVTFVPDEYYANKNAFDYTFALPFGLGFGYDIVDNWRVNFDVMYYWTPTDKLDGWETDRRGFEGFSMISVGFKYIFEISGRRSGPSRARVNQSFSQRKNYSFDALGDDKIQDEYKRKKKRGNLTPVSNKGSRGGGKNQNPNQKIFKQKRR